MHHPQSLKPTTSIGDQALFGMDDQQGDVWVSFRLLTVVGTRRAISVIRTASRVDV
jgi:hypothetical protein